jgi:hypothetical protein
LCVFRRGPTSCLRRCTASAFLRQYFALVYEQSKYFEYLADALRSTRAFCVSICTFALVKQVN